MKKALAVELLAPAGSPEGLRIALGAGADAVYAGGALFGARAYAKNFTQEELLEGLRLSHLHGKKLYLTVNTLLKNRELEEMLIPYLRPLVQEGLDAVLVQDMGVLTILKEAFPDLPLHASTQMTVTGKASMAFLRSLGVSRVVPARELSLEELTQMHRACPEMEIEAFIHGALCYSYSGLCLFSSLLGGRSGNRGRCAQPCRLPYQFRKEGKERVRGEGSGILSMKDLNTLELLPDLIQAGVVSLKIEGRMKQPGYAGGVTAIYRRYLDLLLEKGPDQYHVRREDEELLLGLYSRGGSCQGYFRQQNGSSMLFWDNTSKTQEKDSAFPGLEKKGICGILRIREGVPVSLTLDTEDGRGGSVCVTAYGNCPQKALAQPLSREDLLQKLDRLGDTPFVWDNLDVILEEGLFLPLSALHALRRKALEDLEDALLKPYQRREALPLPKRKRNRPGSDSESSLEIYAECQTGSQAGTALTHPGVKGVYVPAGLVEELLPLARTHGKEVYLILPHVMRGDFPAWLLERLGSWLESGLTGFLAKSLEDFALLKKYNLSGKCVTDHSLYAWNDRAAEFWMSQGACRVTLPLELNEAQLRNRWNGNGEMLVYGILPLMISAQCPHKNVLGCSRKESLDGLLDRKGTAFPVQCVCDPWKSRNTEKPSFCYTILYNSLPLSLLQEADRIKTLGLSSIRLAFLTEKEGEVTALLDAFAAAFLEKGQGRDIERKCTKGHFKRGVE